jgi:hAT family C-terminal dimerisation region
MLHRRMRSNQTTSHIFRIFLQRNRPTIMLVHTIRASIASTSLFDIQGLFFFVLYLFRKKIKLFHYYCLGSMEPDGIDILGYSKRIETAYPTLAMMARDIFIVSVSTVPSESCFSSAKQDTNRSTDQRGRLGAKTFERLVYFKDWYEAE